MPSPVGGLGACRQKKKSILRQKLCNSEQVLVLLSYITAESGGLSPSPESGGPIRLSPLLRRLCPGVGVLNPENMYDGQSMF